MDLFLLIPWFKLEAWSLRVPYLGSLAIQPFGLLAAAAIVVGSRCAQRRAAQLALSRELMDAFILRTTVVGLFSAYVLNVVMYTPEAVLEIARDPSLLVRRWYGLSSYGGFIGGTLAAIVFARRRGVSLLALGDAWCYAIPFAWFFARLGCFVVHDHPGAASDFFLAVDNYNGSGVARHDLGLYEVLWAAVVSGLFLGLDRSVRPAGLYFGLIPMLYGPARFFLDFLRALPLDGGDVRYLGLTPAQYLSLLLTLFGLAFCTRHLMHVQHRSNAGPG